MMVFHQLLGSRHVATVQDEVRSKLLVCRPVAAPHQERVDGHRRIGEGGPGTPGADGT